jgi:hypothetical protein
VTGQFSEDGYWYWDGTAWIPAEQAPKSEEPETLAGRLWKRMQDSEQQRKKAWASQQRAKELVPLREQIAHFNQRGFRVVAQTSTTAQMVRPRKFSFFWFIVSVLTCIGPIIYLGWYLAKKEETIYLVGAPEPT